MTTDVIVALKIAEDYLEKGDWVNIIHDKPTRPVWMHIGTVHKLADGSDWRESHIISYMIKDGVAVKHSGL